MGSTSTKFKNIYSNHKESFNSKLKIHFTELSNYIWELKDENIDYYSKWEILCKTKTKSKYKKTGNFCSKTTVVLFCNKRFYIVNILNHLPQSPLMDL